MKRVTRITTITGAVLATAVVASSVVGTHLADNNTPSKAALTSTRVTPDSAVEKKIDSLIDKMTTKEKLAAGPAALRRPDQRRRGQGRRRRGLLAHRPQADQPLPAPRGRAVAAAHPDPVRLRHDPRLPHDLPGAAGCGELLRPRRGAHRCLDRRPRVRDGRHQADLQPDGRRLPRSPLGSHRRGQRRGPLPRLRDGGRPRARRPGHRLRREGQDRHLGQALRRVRRRGGRSRLQHHRHVRVDAAQPLPAPVQGRGGCRLRHGDVLLQRAQRGPRLRQQGHRDQHPQEGVGLRRLHRERLHRRLRDPGLPAEEPRRDPRPVRARHRGRRRRGRLPTR